jgi:hypothetical protein
LLILLRSTDSPIHAAGCRHIAVNGFERGDWRWYSSCPRRAKEGRAGIRQSESKTMGNKGIEVPKLQVSALTAYILEMSLGLLVLTWAGGDVDICQTTWGILEFPIRMRERLMIPGISPLWKVLLPRVVWRINQACTACNNEYWYTTTFPAHAGTCSTPCGGADNFSRPRARNFARG